MAHVCGRASTRRGCADTPELLLAQAALAMKDRCDGRPRGSIVVKVAALGRFVSRGTGPAPTIWGGGALSRALAGSFIAMGIAGTSGCTSIDPGPDFVVGAEVFDADYYYCHIEPNFIMANKCGPGQASDNGSCHFSSV